MAGGKGACMLLVHFTEAGEMEIQMENINGEAREWTKRIIGQVQKVVISK